MSNKTRLTRRQFSALIGTGAAASLAGAGCAPQGPGPQEAKGEDPLPILPLTETLEPGDRVLAPPPGTAPISTACDYCIVGCGYKAWVWPVGQSGSCDVDNAVVQADGCPVGESAHNIVTRDGIPHHVVVMADPDADVVNPGGDYGNGGALAKKLYNPDTGTRDRLLQPTLRMGNERVAIPWSQALDIAAQVISASRQDHGELSFGMKSFSYNYYENTYALTRFMFHEDAMHSPCWAPHDQPASGSSTPGLSDAGVNAFSAGYDDWKQAEVIFVSGVSLMEARPVLFHNWVKANAKLIVVNPRRDATAAWAAENGGMHLQINPGTDTLLQNAIARVILENGWEDEDFLENWIGDQSHLDQESDSKWRRRRFATTLGGYRNHLFSDPIYEAHNAAEVCGLARGAVEIQEAAALLAKTRDGRRPRASFMLEKGNYWSVNYENTASFASLGLLCGAGNRSGRMISRGGGHQRGMLKAASYPGHKIPLSAGTFEGHPIPFNLDKWAAQGNLRSMWVIGTTWFGAMANSAWLRGRIRARTTSSAIQLSRGEHLAGGGVDVDAVVERLKARMAEGGMVLMQSDVYPNAVTELADLVFPASGWGEHPFTRMQGERRLRLYDRICDPPGEAKADWWIVAQVAQRMGFPGFNWADENEIFEDAAEVSRSRGAHNYGDLMQVARNQGISGHEVLRRRGTRGYQCPVQLAGGQLQETPRMHESGFSTASGRAFLVIGDWRTVEVRRNARQPSGDELWFTNMRTNAWQSLYDDRRIAFKKGCMPDAIIQIHPTDAEARQIQSGDEVSVSCDSVSTMTEGTTQAEILGLAHVTSDVAPGLMCGYFNFRGQVEKAVNSLTPGDVDPVSGLYGFKLARGRVAGTGRRSPFADQMSFVSRGIFGAS
jgi:arsenite oxidase large subunit